MDPPFNVQVFSHSASKLLALLHGLKKILSYSNYSYGAVYETIDGPHYFGDQSFQTAQDRLPVLTLMGGERAVGRHAKTHRYRQRSSVAPKDVMEQSGLSEEPFCADDLVPMSFALGEEGFHSPGAQQ